MRYHVISLVAVFLALAIGILLGTTLVERGLISEKKQEIKSLRKTFNEIKENNNSLRSELDTYKVFAHQSRPYLLANRLTGKSFMVLATEKPGNNQLARISETVASAGGSTPVSITIANAKVFNEPTVVDSLSKLFQLPPQAQLLKERVFAEIVNEGINYSNPPVLQELERIGVISLSGNLTGPVSGGILIGGERKPESEEFKNTDIPLIRAFTVTNYPLLGVGWSNTPDSVMIAYKQTGISTVDHVETVPGQVAMVMVLEGRAGNYGSGKEATRLIPAPAGP
jgi:hypothetical protein